MYFRYVKVSAVISIRCNNCGTRLACSDGSCNLILVKMCWAVKPLWIPRRDPMEVLNVVEYAKLFP